MEVKTSFSKASRFPETVSTLINEEFVLVHQKSEDSSGNDEKPQLKVFILKCVAHLNAQICYSKRSLQFFDG